MRTFAGFIGSKVILNYCTLWHNIEILNDLVSRDDAVLYACTSYGLLYYAIVMRASFLFPVGRLFIAVFLPNIALQRTLLAYRHSYGMLVSFVVSSY